MSLLSIAGPTEQENAKTETVNSSLRAEIVKRVALGGGWSVGVAVIFGAFELIRSEPHEAFPLLKSWGPWAIVSIVALYVLYDLAKIALNIGVRMVRALEELAIAQQKSADKDDRQVQEMQTLTAYTAQQTERTYQKMSEISDGLGALNQKFDEWAKRDG